MQFPTTFMGWVLFLTEKYGKDFMRGLGVTLELAILGTIIGSLLGFLVGVIRSVKVDKHSSPLAQIVIRLLKAVLAIYVEVIRSTPLMVQAMVLYYGTMSIWGWDIPSFTAGIFALTVHIGAYFSESVRGAIRGIDPGQMEGGQAIGMSYTQIMYHVIVPQAFRNLIPQIGNTFVSAIKDTSVLNVIAVTELYFTARTVTGTYYKFFETYIIICVIYFVCTFTIAHILKLIEKLMAGKSSYELIEEAEEVTE